MNYRLVLIVFFYLSVNVLYGQCVSTTSGIIKDADTTHFVMVVENAINDTLGSNGQGLCAVCLNFKHDFVGDILAELVAPDGESVILLGPPTLNSINTQFVNWDVCFLAPSLTANPDPGFSETWNNLQSWSILSSYDGSYYPFNGTLDDFNGGEVNGTWTLRFIDISNLGSGELLDWELIFCDDQGIGCHDCEPDVGEIASQNLTHCEGDTDLLFTIMPTYNPDPPDPNAYDFMHVIVEGEVILDYQSEANLVDYNPGIYQICGMSISDNEVVNLPVPNSNFGLDSLESLIDKGTFCAELSNDCYVINILAIPDTTYLNETICDGESIEVGGSLYEDQGIYTININANSCDSVVILDLKVTELIPFITPIITNLSCTLNEVVLFGGLSQVGPMTQYEWFTEDGSISGPTDQQSAIATEGGKYYLALHEGNCHDTISIIVIDESINPSLTFSADTLNCSVDSVMIELVSDLPIVSYNWQGPSLSQIDIPNPYAFEEGWYFVEVVAANGCTHVDSIEVIYDGELPNPSFTYGEITCQNPQTQISTQITGSYEYNWVGPFPFISNDSTFTVQSGGSYQLTITASNGCTDVHVIEIMELTDPPDVSIQGDTIFCNDPVAEISASIPLGATIEWTGPNNFNVDSVNFSTASQGTYFVEVVDSNGCQLDTFVEIPLDTIYPFIQFASMQPLVDCNDSTQLDFTYNNVFSETQYTWEGPHLYNSNDANPWISQAGEYFILIENPNGCSYIDSIIISNGPGVPDVDFFSNEINCFNTTTQIIPDNSSDYSFVWNGPGYSGTDPQPVVSAGGVYHVTVTDNNLGCTSKEIVWVNQDIEVPEISINGGYVNCKNDPVNLSFNSSISILSNQWTLPDGSSSSSSSLSTTTLGWYYLDVVGENGCTQSDSFEIIANQLHPSIVVRDTFIGCDQVEVQLFTESNMPVQYLWSGPGVFDMTSPSPIVNQPGTYRVTVSAENLCSNIGVLEVIEDKVIPSIQVSGVLSIDCQSPITEINILSNADIVNYIWTGPQPIGNTGNPSISLPGDYTVEIEARNFCKNQISFTIEADDALPQFQINNPPITCLNNETTTVTLDPELASTAFSWTGPNNFTAQGTEAVIDTPGIYFIEAVDLTGCISITPLLVETIVYHPQVSQITQGIISCYDPEVTLGIYSSDSIVAYCWTGPDNFTSDLQEVLIDTPGEYIGKITMSSGCSTMESINVEIDTISPNVVASGTVINCLENKVPLSFTTDVMPDSIYWIGPNFTSNMENPTVISVGTYTAYVVGPNGCIGQDSYEVLEDFAMPVFESFDAHLPCNGNPVQIQTIAQDSATYIWFGPSNFFSEDQEPFVEEIGEYYVFATGTNGCIRSDTILVDDIPIPPIFSAIEGNITCASDSAQLIAVFSDDDDTAEWVGSNGFYSDQDTAYVTEVGDYQLIVTGFSNGCKDTILVSAGIDTIPPYAEISFPDTLRCSAQMTTLDGLNSDMGDSHTALWTTEEGNIRGGWVSYAAEIDKAGTYYLQITDLRNGCIDIDSIEVIQEENTLAGVEFSLEDPQCAGFLNGSLTVEQPIGGNPPYTYAFDGSNFSDAKAYYFIGSGHYILSVKDSAQCIADTLVFMPEGLMLSVDLGADTTITLGQSISINAEINVDPEDLTTINWASMSNVPCSDCLAFDIGLTASTMFEITIEDKNGCEASDSKMVLVSDAGVVYTPTAFSPNGDDVNDEYILFSGPGVAKFELLNILDNWGNIVHEMHDFLPGDPAANWDGMYRNFPLPAGVYSYIVEYTLITGEKKFKTGVITLLR